MTADGVAVGGGAGGGRRGGGAAGSRRDGGKSAGVLLGLLNRLGLYRFRRRLTNCFG